MSEEMKNVISREEKEELQNILKENRDWHEVEELPEVHKAVVIRIFNPDKIAYEDEKSIYYVEDIMVARWSGEEWNIEPPYHKYNYSPLTAKNKLLEGAVVSHWADLEEGELEGWHSRLDYFNQYNELSVNVDPDKEEDVYRAIMWGASFVEQAYRQTADENSRQDLEKFFQYLKDLQYSIDKTATADDESE